MSDPKKDLEYTNQLYKSMNKLTGAYLCLPCVSKYYEAPEIKRKMVAYIKIHRYIAEEPLTSSLFFNAMDHVMFDLIQKEIDKGIFTVGYLWGRAGLRDAKYNSYLIRVRGSSIEDLTQEKVEEEFREHGGYCICCFNDVNP